LHQRIFCPDALAFSTTTRAKRFNESHYKPVSYLGDPISDLSRETNSLTGVLHGFIECLQENATLVPENRP
jgi:hypothetical protein